MDEPILITNEFNRIIINPQGVKFLYRGSVYLDYPSLVEIAGVSRSKMHRILEDLGEQEGIRIRYLGKDYFLESFCIQFINYGKRHF